MVFCDDEPIAPQLAVVDAYAASAWAVVEHFCDAFKELDPCSTNLMLKDWAKRLGLISDDPCSMQFSDHVIAEMLCIIPTIRGRIFNMAYLEEISGIFGADVIVRPAGDFSDCAPSGWWTMARDRNGDCPPAEDPCPPESHVVVQPIIPMVSTCETLPDSLNIVLCPSDRRFPENCNLPRPDEPHDPELFAAFRDWLLPKILPQPVFWCIYTCDANNCIQ
jgi:hypothetical protein